MDAPDAPPRASHWTAAAVLVLTVLVLAWAAALAALVWMDLAADERTAALALLRPRAGLAFLALLALPGVLWLVVHLWGAAWVRAARRLAEAVSVLASANAAHRISGSGPREMRVLAQVIDRFAQTHAALRNDVDARVDAARAERAAETRRLAALMSELTMAVLVCNREGRVLLYNARASALLGEDGPLGLGRPLAALLDADALEHAWGQVLRLHAQGAPHAVAHFVTALRGGGAAAGALLRVQMVPTLDEAGAPGGYVLLVDDITRAAGAHQRREARLRRLTLGLRSGLANLRAAAQALARYPAMDAGRRAGLGTVVQDEAERLARELDEALREPAEAEEAAEGGGMLSGGYPLDDVQVGDLAWALQRALGAGPRPLSLTCAVEGAGAARRLRINGHAVVQALAALARRLHEATGANDLALEVAGAQAAPRLDLSWRGPALAPGTLEAWEREEGPAGPGSVPGAPAAPPASHGLRELLDRHGAELWSSTAEAGAQRHRLCLQFGRGVSDADGTARHDEAEAGAPATTLTMPPRPRPRAAPPRPIAYDFDLFNQAGQNALLDEQPLATLACTVFDTETTGLRPGEGDEIIALGAVRIVNARLLERECFERRVRPGRPVRASAEAVHGISTASLAGEPPLEAVLPAFARFCGDTVLVAHNAAFDLRFLELARARTGVAFEQAVLDTMLLSAAALPGLGPDEHHLEQIAARLGVPAADRHQALGDALITARVFLKLLPLLAARGILTLGQARAASQGVAHGHETY